MSESSELSARRRLVHAGGGERAEAGVAGNVSACLETRRPADVSCGVLQPALRVGNVGSAGVADAEEKAEDIMTCSEAGRRLY